MEPGHPSLKTTRAPGHDLASLGNGEAAASLSSPLLARAPVFLVPRFPAEKKGGYWLLVRVKVMLVGDRGVKGKCGGFLSRGHRQIQRVAPAELASSGEGGSAVTSAKAAMRTCLSNADIFSSFAFQRWVFRFIRSRSRKVFPT